MAGLASASGPFAFSGLNHNPKRHLAPHGDFPTAQEVYAFRKGFAEAWRGLLHDRFATPKQAAEAFGVDTSTARDWWHGRGAPSGYAVALAFKVMPGTAARFLLDAIGGWLICSIGGRG